MMWCAVVVVLVLLVDASVAVKFKYQRYHWRKKSRYGRQVRKAFQLCETYCEQRGVSEEVARFNCVRSCVSPSCLETLYGEDPYELGEHDVRINSFRGCTSQDFSSGNRGLDTIRALLERDNIDAEAGSGASWNADYDEDDERERDRAEL